MHVDLILFITITIIKASLGIYNDFLIFTTKTFPIKVNLIMALRRKFTIKYIYMETKQIYKYIYIHYIKERTPVRTRNAGVSNSNLHLTIILGHISKTPLKRLNLGKWSADLESGRRNTPRKVLGNIRKK